MNKKHIVKTILGCAIFVLILAGYNSLQGVIGNDSVRTLEMLQSYLVGGHVFDADGSLGVNDIHDVYYTWDGDKVQIVFGNNIMTFSKEELQDDYISALLSDINLTFDGYTLYYEGQEVPR